MNGRKTITVVFGFASVLPEHAAAIIQKVFKKNNLPLHFEESDGEPITLDKLLLRLAREQRIAFDVVSDGFDILLGQVRNSNLGFFRVEYDPSKVRSDDDWVEPFITRDGFVMAWLADEEYQYWQNAHDPIQYETAGRPFHHLPTRSNDLPPPLTRTIIDTTRNPGRRVHRNGYLEAVGSVMWLGKSFWSLTGANEANVLKANWLQTTVLEGGVLKARAATECFISAEGESGELQNRLRALLFPAATFASG